MGNEELKYPLYVISRLRMATDGVGVTTLVTSVGCPLRCKYCINPYTWAEHEKLTWVTAEELYEKVKIDNLYFITTGGGITFGGGEPLLQADFIKEFITKYKKTGWKFNLETSISVPWENIEKVIDLFDAISIDSKDMDKTRYKLYTEGDLDLFVSNLKKIIERVDLDKFQVRVPYIEGYNTREDVEENVKILKDMGVRHIDVFDYVIRDKNE